MGQWTKGQWIKGQWTKGQWAKSQWAKGQWNRVSWIGLSGIRPRGHGSLCGEPVGSGLMIIGPMILGSMGKEHVG